MINYYFVRTNECSWSQSGKSPLYYSVANNKKREVTVTFIAEFITKVLKSFNAKRIGEQYCKIFPYNQRDKFIFIYSFGSRSISVITELLLKNHNETYFYNIFEEYSAIYSYSMKSHLWSKWQQAINNNEAASC